MSAYCYHRSEARPVAAHSPLSRGRTQESETHCNVISIGTVALSRSGKPHTHASNARIAQIAAIQHRQTIEDEDKR